jgi:hypothetical protein
MGAAGSINNIVTNNIYISYDNTNSININIKTLLYELSKTNFTLIYSEMINTSFQHSSYEIITKNIEKIMETTSYFIFCVSETTTKSFHQAIEIDNALNANKNIVYLITNKIYTPKNNSLVNGFIKDKLWLPFYDEESVFESLHKLTQMINL